MILHVVLFPPPPGSITIGAAGREIPVLPFLPWLHHDLEEYAAEEAVEHLANRPASLVLERLGGLAPAQLDQLLRGHSEQRWRQKVHFARLRMQRLGWEAACHSTALEILGYRFNRTPMLRVAGQWPLAAWAGGGIDVRKFSRASRRLGRCRECDRQITRGRGCDNTRRGPPRAPIGRRG